MDLDIAATLAPPDFEIGIPTPANRADHFEDFRQHGFIPVRTDLFGDNVVAHPAFLDGLFEFDANVKMTVQMAQFTRDGEQLPVSSFVRIGLHKMDWGELKVVLPAGFPPAASAFEARRSID